MGSEMCIRDRRIIEFASRFYALNEFSKTPPVSDAPIGRVNGRLNTVSLWPVSATEDLLAVVTFGQQGFLGQLLINTSNQIGALIQRAIAAYLKLYVEESNQAALDQLNDLINNFDLFRYAYNERDGDRVAQTVAPWIVRFCRVASSLGLVQITSSEEQALSDPLRVIKAHD